MRLTKYNVLGNDETSLQGYSHTTELNGMIGYYFYSLRFRAEAINTIIRIKWCKQSFTFSMVELVPNLNVAMMTKGRFPEKSIVVSLESDKESKEDFWSDPEIIDALPEGTMLVRLTKENNASDFNLFQTTFNFFACPGLVYFAANSASPAHQWHDFPTRHEFLVFFDHKEKPKAEEVKVRSDPKCRILVVGKSAAIQRQFEPNDRLSELKKWLAMEIGEGVQVIVSHTHLPLPEEDMSLEEAGLMPSAELRVIAGDVSAPTIRLDENGNSPIESQAAPRQRCLWFQNRVWKPIKDYATFGFGFINPWDDEPESDLVKWEFEGNAELRNQIREHVRQAGGMVRTAAQEVEA